MDATATSASAAERLAVLIDRRAGAADVAAFLDALDAWERIRQCRELSGKQQARLYELAGAGEPLTLDDLVPPSLGEGKVVAFAGKNSLPAFSLFEKHFVRQGGVIVGINVQTMSFATGPGYYTCRAGEGSSVKEVLFDYTSVPSSAPAGWPEPRSNARGLSHFVYKNLHDYNRRVARDVVIGSATRLGKPMDSWYVLARKP